MIATVKKDVELKAENWVSFDMNLTNVTALVDGAARRYDLKSLYHIHRVYELKRRRIQKLSKYESATSKHLMEKYSMRERNRAKDFMHKLTTSITKELRERGCGAILENIKNIKSRILDRSKNSNRKLSKWNARTFQSMLEYKLKWVGLPVKYVNPANSSRTCPLCSGSMASHEGRLMKCERCKVVVDRGVVAVINLQMWGAGSSPKGEEAGESQELRVFTKDHIAQNPPAHCPRLYTLGHVEVRVATLVLKPYHRHPV